MRFRVLVIIYFSFLAVLTACQNGEKETVLEERATGVHSLFKQTPEIIDVFHGAEIFPRQESIPLSGPFPVSIDLVEGVIIFYAKEEFLNQDGDLDHASVVSERICLPQNAQRRLQDLVIESKICHKTIVEHGSELTCFALPNPTFGLRQKSLMPEPPDPYRFHRHEFFNKNDHELVVLNDGQCSLAGPIEFCSPQKESLFQEITKISNEIQNYPACN